MTQQGGQDGPPIGAAGNEAASGTGADIRPRDGAGQDQVDVGSVRDSGVLASDPEKAATEIAGLLGTELADKLTGAQLLFLAVLVRCGNAKMTAKITGISLPCHHKWKLSDHYCEAFEVCTPLILDVVEQTAFMLGVEGKRRYKFDKDGQPIMWTPPGESEKVHYYETEHDARVLQTLLQAYGPDKFIDRLRQETIAIIEIKRIEGLLAPGEVVKPAFEPKKLEGGT